MTEELKDDPTVKWGWEVTLKDSSVHALARGVSYDDAKLSWSAFKNSLGLPMEVRLAMTEVEKDFGFTGRYSGGVSVQTSAWRPRTKVEEQMCPRRGEGGAAPIMAGPTDHWEAFPNGQRVCTYCGSLHPDDLLALLKEHGVTAIEWSTKGYKLYLSDRFTAPNAALGPIKFYTMHATDEVMQMLQRLRR